MFSIGDFSQLGQVSIRALLMLKQAEIAQQMQAMQAQMRHVGARLRQIEREGQLPQYEVVIKSVEAQPILSARGVVPALDDRIGICCSLVRGHLSLVS